MNAMGNKFQKDYITYNKTKFKNLKNHKICTFVTFNTIAPLL